MLNRRGFMGATAVAGLAGPRLFAQAASPEMMTVTGAIPANKLGLTLPHEHIMVDFIGAAESGPHRYESDEVFAAVLPHLKKIRDLGCRSLIECTPAYLARDPQLLARLSRASGVQILTNTGYYGARDDQHLPPHAFTETAVQLAARWTREWTRGIGDTGIRPGFIKIGVDRGPLSEVDAKLVTAAARCHKQTGLTIACHTGPAEAAFEQLDILQAQGVKPEALIWVHAGSEKNKQRHVDFAKRGGWVSFDGVSEKRFDLHIQLVANMKQAGLLDRVIVSQDAGWYRVGEPGGGAFRPFDMLLTDFLPALKKAGLSDEDVQQLTVNNPAKAFAIGKRLL
jgi:phosphotriesterase-related protein